jgi:hypothetical protein
VAAAGLVVCALTLAACSSGPVSSPAATAWVATEASVTLPGSSITPVDLATGQREPKVDIGSLPSAMTFLPGNAGLLVVSQGTDLLREVNPTTHAVEHSVTTGVEPDAIAVAPGGTGGHGIALVANLDANTVTPVDLGTWRAGKPIAVGTEPVAIGVVHRGGADVAFVADFGSNEVTPISLPSLAAGPPIAVGLSPQTIAVSGASVLVGDFGDHTLVPIDASTMSASPAVALPVPPSSSAVDPSGTTLYITGSDSLVPVALPSLVVGTPITVPDVAQAVAFSDSGAMAWVALEDGGLVSVALRSGRVGHPIHLGGHPSAVAIAE